MANIRSAEKGLGVDVASALCMSSFIAFSLPPRLVDVKAHEQTLTSSGGNAVILGVIGGTFRRARG